MTLCNYVNHFSLSFFLDFSHRRPPPVSDHFVVHQGWSLRRELTVCVRRVSSVNFSFANIMMHCVFVPSSVRDVQFVRARPTSAVLWYSLEEYARYG